MPWNRPILKHLSFDDPEWMKGRRCHIAEICSDCDKVALIVRVLPALDITVLPLSSYEVIPPYSFARLDSADRAQPNFRPNKRIWWEAIRFHMALLLHNDKLVSYFFDKEDLDSNHE